MLMSVRSMRLLNESLFMYKRAAAATPTKRELRLSLDRLFKQTISIARSKDELLDLYGWSLTWADHIYMNLIIDKMYELHIKAQNDAEAEEEILRAEDKVYEFVKKPR